MKSLIRIFSEPRCSERNLNGTELELKDRMREATERRRIVTVADKSHEELLMREWLLIGLERSGFRLGMDGRGGLTSGI